MLALCIILLCSTSSFGSCNQPRGEDRRLDTERLRIATFNAAWLFDGINDPSFSEWPTASAAAFHVQKVAEQLERIDADIIVLQEVENCNVLSSLVGYLGSSYRFWLLDGTDSATGQNVALVTRVDPLQALVRTSARVDYPVMGSTCGATTEGSSSVSKNALARFEIDGISFHLLFAHFKSGGRSSDCLQREAQAEVLKAFQPSGEVIILGDLNEFDETFTDGNGRRGSSQTLTTLRGNDLYNVALEMPQSERETVSIGLIDHILISKGIRARLDNVKIDSQGYPSSSGNRLAAGFSDHVPYYITLRTAATSVLLPSITVFVIAMLLALL